MQLETSIKQKKARQTPDLVGQSAAKGWLLLKKSPPYEARVTAACKLIDEAKA